MKQHLDELWGRVEDLSQKLKDDPENRATAILLSAVVDDYNAKLKLYIQDNERQENPRRRQYEG